MRALGRHIKRLPIPIGMAIDPLYLFDSSDTVYIHRLLHPFALFFLFVFFPYFFCIVIFRFICPGFPRGTFTRKKQKKAKSLAAASRSSRIVQYLPTNPYHPTHSAAKSSPPTNQHPCRPQSETSGGSGLSRRLIFPFSRKETSSPLVVRCSKVLIGRTNSLSASGVLTLRVPPPPRRHCFIETEHPFVF
jgi:hypothetical protein